MAALDESRLSEDWVGDDVAANGKNGSSDWDYSPSAPHRPKVIAPSEEKEKAATAQVESRYKRNSAKLPRIGIEPGSSSDSISNLRKKIVSDD